MTGDTEYFSARMAAILRFSHETERTSCLYHEDNRAKLSPRIDRVIPLKSRKSFGLWRLPRALISAPALHFANANAMRPQRRWTNAYIGAVIVCGSIAAGTGAFLFRSHDLVKFVCFLAISLLASTL